MKKKRTNSPVPERKSIRSGEGCYGRTDYWCECRGKGVGTNGVITNLDGEFTLEVPENASLIISYIGYLQQDVSTKGKMRLTSS